MQRSLALLAALSVPASLFAQSSPVLTATSETPMLARAVTTPTTVAALEPVADATLAASPNAPLPDAPSTPLPDAPSAVASSSLDLEDQAGVAPTPGSNRGSIAPKYAGVILPGQSSVRLSAGNKIVYGFTDAFSPFSLVGSTLSAGYSHLVDSAPHYGTNSTAFGKREGVALLRNTVQALATDSLFSPIFHDDPRYYEFGGQHRLIPRLAYAVTRVVVTRSDDGHNRVNAPLLLGYGVAAGLNNLYYPDRDTGAKQTLQSYGSSLGGAALGMIANEFLDDALHFVHIRK